MRLRILANLGFLLQSCGLILLIPLLVGVYYNEIGGTIAVALGCISFLVAGFLLNTLCEKRELDYKSSCVLILLAFLMMSALGAIPYAYLDPFQSATTEDRLVNSFFESVSGFTTTGFSFIPEAAVLPKCFALYRSMTELMGGVGVVFILLVFFQSEHALNHLGSALGIDNVGLNLRKAFGMVLLVYGVYVLAFTVPVFLLGFPDVISAVTLVIDTMTGGFSPSAATFEARVGLPLRIVLLFLMLLGSLNFKFNYYFIRGKLRSAVNEEARLYLVIIIMGSVLITLFSGLNLFDSVFHVVSMSSATGFDYVGIWGLSEPAKAVFLGLILVGGCAASMAGGIKVVNVLWSTRGIRETITEVLSGEKVISSHKKPDPKTMLKWNMATSSILLYLATLIALSLVFSTSGVPFWDSLWEVGSALSTNGFTTGATNIALPVFYKLLLVAAMIIGRVEFIVILASIYVGKPIVAEALKSVRSRMSGFTKDIVKGE